MKFKRDDLSKQKGSRPGIVSRWGNWVAPAVLSLGLSVGTASADVVVTKMTGPSITAPLNGFIAQGNATFTNSQNVAQKVRHLWIQDHIQGLCRVDPHIDSPEGTVYSIGTYCAPLPSGPVAYDPDKQLIYVIDEVANKANQGMVRRPFNPLGDAGRGTIGGSTKLGDSSSCGITGNRPSAVALGPDGNVYVTFLKSGNIMRVTNPSATTVGCGNFVTIGSSGARRNLGVTWVNHTLYGLGDIAPFRMINADQCATPAHPGSCVAEEVFPDTTLIAGPIGIGSSQVKSALPNAILYISQPNGITKIENPDGLEPVVTPDWATGGMLLPSSITADTAGQANPDIFVGDDPTGGAGVSKGKIYRVNANVVPTPPSAPTAVIATAMGEGALVSWAPGAAGSKPTTNYKVYIFDASGVSEVLSPQSTAVGAPAPTSLNVTGLTPGQSYVFRVTGVNAVNESAMSDATAPVTALALTAPITPTGLSAIAGTDKTNKGVVALSWLPLTTVNDTGGSPIAFYTIQYHNGGTPVTINVPGNLSGTTITGLDLLVNNVYTFQISATNGANLNSSFSPVFEVTFTLNPVNVDMALQMNGPGSVDSGADVVYNITTTNAGNVNVPDAILTVQLPAAGYDTVTPPVVSTSRGSCLPVDNVNHTISCNIGSMNPLDTANVSVTLKAVTGKITSSATVADYSITQSGLVALSDSTPLDNTGSVTTNINVPPPPQEPVTDLQINSGSVKGGGTRNTSATFSFSLRNGSGEAHGVVFTLPLPGTYTFVSAVANGNACQLVNVSGVNTVTCNIGTVLAGGQVPSISINVIPTIAGTVPLIGKADFLGYSTDTNQANNLRSVQLKTQ